MYLNLVNPLNARATYALTKDEDKCFPKRPEREVAIILDGAADVIRVTGSTTYATAETNGCNGWIRIAGKTFWFVFDSGFDPRAAPLSFTISEGTAPDKTPIRAPKNPTGETERRKNLSTSLLAKYATATATATV